MKITSKKVFTNEKLLRRFLKKNGFVGYRHNTHWYEKVNPFKKDSYLDDMIVVNKNIKFKQYYPGMGYPKTCLESISVKGKSLYDYPYYKVTQSWTGKRYFYLTGYNKIKGI